jgi:riboflavin-specific deaminase-like protein
MPKHSLDIANRARPIAPVVDESEAWSFVRSLVRPGALTDPRLSVECEGNREPTWKARGGVTPEAARVLDLCVPLCAGPHAAELVVAHLGQSLDGRVAVPSGFPRLITGAEDLRHTHRLRALCDAVVVGATTVQVDDPQLTTRLVPGDLPARVVIDPQARLPRDRRMFHDGQAPSVVIVARENVGRCRHLGAHVELVPLPTAADGSIPVRDLLHALRERGLRRIFVEGGGVTVSRFLDAGVLDRLHVAVASRIVGTGVPAIQLDAAGRAGGITAHAKSYLLGADVLFDCDVRAAAAKSS